ncbi:hypothetical protein EV714DRAFT_174707, partial [Schizophyllum commune]
QNLKRTLLAFNPLSAQDLNDIQRYLLHAEAEVNKYSAEIDGLSRLLHLLAKERDELEGKKGELERIRAGVVWRCAPISRLVLNILTEIFCFVRDANENLLRDYESAILPLAQTCRLWRRVALSRPLLWTSIRLCNVNCCRRRADTHFQDRIARAVQFHLDRSGDALLSIRIECHRCSA